MAEALHISEGYSKWAHIMTAGAIALSHAMGGSLEADHTSKCPAVSQEHFEAIDKALSEPVSQKPDSIEGATTYVSLFEKAMTSADAAGQSISRRWELLRSLSMQYYGLDLQLRQEPEVLEDIRRSSAESPAVALPVDVESLTDYDLMLMTYQVAGTPKELFEDTGITSITTYRTQRDSNGYAPDGYVYAGSNTVHAAVGYRALRHELYHVHERKPSVCGLAMNKDEAYANLAATDGPTTDLRSFTDQHRTELGQLTIAGPGQDDNANPDMALNQLAAQHPDEAANVTDTSDYGKLTLAESKAGIIEPWLLPTDTNPDNLLSPHFPSLRSRSRLLLARLHANLPGVALHFIRSTIYSGKFTPLPAAKDTETAANTLAKAVKLPLIPPPVDRFLALSRQPFLRPRRQYTAQSHPSYTTTSS